jgi:hypothetical protein
MIEVILRDLSGVLARAEADDPEAALVAARTLYADHQAAYYGRLTLSFEVEGALILGGVSLADISSSLMAVAS